ncbi:MAG: L-serine ammonia-lyase [Pseudomonadota bacterium]
MKISVFDIFKIGIGPSSSHTVGPMRAARSFALALRDGGTLDAVTEVSAQLYGSLALTGAGHCTDRAVLLGLEGETPTGIDPDAVEGIESRIRTERRLRLLGTHEVRFDEPMNMLFHKDQTLPAHANGMRFTALDAQGETLLQETWYSVGGGFVVRDGDSEADKDDRPDPPYPFASGRELLDATRESGLSIPELVMRNEQTWRTEQEVRDGVWQIWEAMRACVKRGFRTEGVLPGGLKVPRRAPRMYREISAPDVNRESVVLDWVNAWALAVNEENAAGGKVVTAPTNGAAGIVPSVLHYYREFVDGADDEGILRFLLTAGAIGTLYKRNASISGAEMGCQGEVGVACSMAAGGLQAAMGGSAVKIENAAEIGMEHNLGLTCDPIGGLVQIPCIERNAMGAVKSINAARLAARGDGTHKVNLDQVIATMRQTGLDMSTVYKETSQGGLAVNVIEC